LKYRLNNLAEWTCSLCKFDKFRIAVGDRGGSFFLYNLVNGSVIVYEKLNKACLYLYLY
jgi:hypothetical protein